jgi:hypothetical protein
MPWPSKEKFSEPVDEKAMATKTSADQVRPPHLPMAEAVRNGKLVISIGRQLPLS